MLPIETASSIARSTGSQEFMRLMHKLTTQHVRVDHLALEFLDNNRQLIPLDRASISSLPIKGMGKVYREKKVFERDPIREIEARGKRIGNGLLMMINNNSDVDSPEQAELFRQFGIVQRLVIAGKVKGGWLSQKMIRCDHFGPATGSELERLERLAPFLIQMAEPHARLLIWQNSPDSWFHDILHSDRTVSLIFPELSPRETNCIRLVLQGKTNEQAAKYLGISINTLITLRTRAYKKTGATCREDLMSMVRKHLAI